MRRISQEYFDLFRRAVESPDGVFVPLDSKQEARNLRSYLYHFRTQLRESQPNFLGGRYEKLKFSLEPKGLLVHIPAAPGALAIRQVVR